MAIDAAQAAFPKWAAMSMRERSILLNRLADLIHRDLDLLVALESLDNGKPLENSLSDIEEVINNLRYFAGWTDK